jgi:plasmid stabilization system protein ParE
VEAEESVTWGQLRFTPAVERDLAEISDYIADASGSSETARRFAASVETQCANLARLPSTLGRPRSNCGPTFRSFPFKGYAIFFRYLDDEILEVVHIIEDHRDVAAIFAKDDGI